MRETIKRVYILALKENKQLSVEMVKENIYKLYIINIEEQRNSRGISDELIVTRIEKKGVIGVLYNEDIMKGNNEKRK